MGIELDSFVRDEPGRQGMHVMVNVKECNEEWMRGRVRMCVVKAGRTSLFKSSQELPCVGQLAFCSLLIFLCS